MLQKNSIYWVIQILQILHFYVHSQQITSSYQRGLYDIQRILEKTYYKVENKYYKYILEPELQYYFKNERNSD